MHHKVEQQGGKEDECPALIGTVMRELFRGSDDAGQESVAEQYPEQAEEQVEQDDPDSDRIEIEYFSELHRNAATTLVHIGGGGGWQHNVWMGSNK